eukprot:4689719-Lingulodinium_polyedra.AAC.1
MGMARPLTTIDWLLVEVVTTCPLPQTCPRTPLSRLRLPLLLRRRRHALTGTMSGTGSNGRNGGN